MNILFCADKNYADYLIVSIYAILKYNTKNKIINFYILHTNISKTSQQKITELVASYNKNHKAIFITLPEGLFTDFPITVKYISLVTYARLFLSEVYDWQGVDKLLYLDVDISINGDISPLFDTDLQGKTIGACFDSYVEHAVGQEYKKSIGIHEDNHYFNAGVLLIDMQGWQ